MPNKVARVPCSQSKGHSIKGTMLERSSEKFFGSYEIRTRASDSEVRTLPLSYVVPQCLIEEACNSFTWSPKLLGAPFAPKSQTFPVWASSSELLKDPTFFANYVRIKIASPQAKR